MFADNLLPLGVVALIVAAVVVDIYYTLFVEQAVPHEPGEQAANHYPLLDDETAYLTASLYPHHEFMHHMVPFPTN
jgi:hypothetical protein